MTFSPRVCSTTSPVTVDTRDERRADLGAVVVRDHQNLVERDGGARLAFERGDGNDIIGGDAILLAAGLDHCEHLIVLVFEPGSPREDPQGRLFGSFRLHDTATLRAAATETRRQGPRVRGVSLRELCAAPVNKKALSDA